MKRRFFLPRSGGEAVRNERQRGLTLERLAENGLVVQLRGRPPLVRAALEPSLTRSEREWQLFSHFA